uniref:Riboflavin biosynthesis protein RibD n=1 Tax=Candidatus Kentrum sp. DK TaxID=2126562 RepID=A0A450T6Y9_9GAMM|nr:MAG: diaminohydroxyphosphoribosylaminopyrimidine deaminase / 5-amino-6-(5-phosphoribosylamino)uracil reductase [Candidatus Kentron sp. DK]VFJ62494.1 MAG: diaminohydroxyphosphoribosylaminopyrimidine deaminase / 5-amino-6-(5-phosphoribosylamino)uracil reductase [Candidatus Kentron sp. DK]
MPPSNPAWDAADYRFMARAIRLARRGLFTTDPNPRVGCVLARGGDVVGEGWHERAGLPHAERNALTQAGEAARGATAYVTLEPCCHVGRTGPCTRALLASGVRRVVGAMTDPNPRVSGQGFAELEGAGVRVETGLMALEAEALNPGFCQRFRQGRPFVRCKLAMSLDGRTAMSSGESQWITGPPARRDVQRLRARSSAILTGLGTVLTDNPSLTVRPEEWAPDAPYGDAANIPVRQPLRVVLDPKLATPLEAAILRSGEAPTLLIAASDHWAEDRAEAIRGTGTQVAEVPGVDDALDLRRVMEYLAECEINEVLLECGARLAGAMLREGLIDELIVYLAPTLMGSDARGLFALPEIRRMADRRHLEIAGIRPVGRDWRITARPVA